MTRIISICNAKGGVGKTTTAMNIAAFLGAFGKRVLLVDIDPQANATSGMGFHNKRHERSVYHALIGKEDPGKLIKKTNFLAVDILPASPSLAGASIELVHMRGREFKLKDVLLQVARKYDFIIVDSPPSLGLLTINALTAAHKVLIPVQCEYYALEGLADLLHTIQLVNANLKSRTAVMGALLTMYDRKSKLHRAVAKEIRRKFPGYVFETTIPRNVSLAEAPSFGKTILQYSPYSHGAKAYRQLVEEILRLEEGRVS